MEPLACLKDFIGIDDCSGTQPASGLFINKDLPISLESIDKIADSEQITYLTVWDEAQNRGIPKFIIRVKAGWQELYGKCDLIDDWFCTNKLSLAYTLLYFLGSELMYDRAYSPRRNMWTGIDRDKALAMKSDFDAEFQVQLKAALQIINDDEEVETDIIEYVVDLP